MLQSQNAENALRRTAVTLSLHQVAGNIKPTSDSRQWTNKKELITETSKGQIS